MQSETIIQKVEQILIEEFELEADQLTSEARLRDDLDLDSLDGVDLIVALENAFSFKIDNRVIVEMQTIGDIHAYIREQIDAPASATPPPA